jgi:2-polyprenyl-3-methyl-5-hydroxy-6-metoxy-1,4-benzoquinol methylase
MLEAIQAYWNEHIHDVEVTREPVGTAGFFKELDEYRFGKLPYLLSTIDFTAYRGKRLLEVGCGVGIDLARFAEGGAEVTGVDLSERAIDLAKRNFELHGLRGELRVMNGEAMEFGDDQFDVAYAHGVIQYTADAQRLANELYRVLKPCGEAILVAYNRYSWLNLLSKLVGVPLEHEDAPVLRKHSSHELRSLLNRFSSVRIVPERFPVRTQLHHGVNAVVYNSIFVRVSDLLPRPLMRPFGWHLVVRAIK